MLDRIIELKITEDGLLDGVDGIAFVEKPAIELEFLAFSKEEFETFNDYPKKAVANAKRGIELNKENGNKCATQVGKVRAQQLANGENVSLDTIRRMRAFLIRQKDNYDLAVSRKDYTACGYISYLLWGGAEALPWAEKKLRQAGEDFAEQSPRGAIKPSKKAPKSDTKNPNPKGKGSARGSAKTTRGAKVDKATEKTLKDKSDSFNKRYKDKLGYGTNVGTLKAVYQRGLGAYNTSRSPNVSSAKQWALARVNAYLFLVKNGRPQNKKYTTDFDLLPKGHPKSEKMSAIIEGMIKETLFAEKSFYKAVGEVDGMPYYTTAEEARAQSPKYGCSMDSWHEHKIDGKTYYMPCGSHGKLFEDLDDEIQDDIIDALKQVGVKMEDFSNRNVLKGASNPNKKTILDRGDRRVLFRYTRADGSFTTDGKERDFCSKMLELSRQGYLWRKEDINSLTIKGANNEFGVYDLFAYKGSYNCRHVWKAVEFKEETADDMSKEDTKRPLAVLDGYISAGTSLNKDIVRKMFSQEDLDEQQVVATPIMVPNKLIKRRDEQGEYHVFFTEETIKQIAYKFAEMKAGDAINHEHDLESMIDDTYLAESWLVEEPTNDKSNTYGFELPAGTWFGLFKVKNDDYWNDYIKSGKVKGVSVEGMFINQLSKLK